jgi:two-component system sensor histidine kinase HupT/HoxJ
MVHIISELLEFSRSTHSAFEIVPVDRIIEDSIKIMESAAGQVKITVIRDYRGDAPCIRGGSLFQVFCNLIKNAADAMDRKGELKITIGCSDGKLSVEFRDTGPGFGSENAEKLFEPFFTTKSSGRGTGLGLAICKDIIEKYEGMITAENAPEGGSIFKVQLPMNLDDPSQK